MTLKGELSNTFGQRALFAANGDINHPGAQYAATDVNPDMAADIGGADLGIKPEIPVV